MKSVCRVVAPLVLLTFLPMNGLSAATVVWGGGTGDYLTGGNWEGGEVPGTASGNTAEINSGAVTYTPGGDLAIHNGGALVLNGGSWTQAGGNAWIQLGSGSLIVAGGTFNQGTSDNIVRNSDSNITVSAGIANFSGNFLNRADFGDFTITGGTVNIANEFKPISSFTMTGGTLSATMISFADGPGIIDFTGGTISVDGGSFYSGFYGGGSQSLNFSTASTGSLFFRNYSLTALAEDGFLTNGTLQWDGAIDPTAFSAVESEGGVLITVIPEPSTPLTLLGGMGALMLLRRRKSN
ncbi:carbohydrate-binding domain-containing protein [Luteolibacter arcticus]|uniref:Carbohydrate-binding domain-containing protein n=1 Tax=Luteolibacter arcticus TaxID=1581411 RepID=A0ABT3GEV6_9BACT|nr:carbohydrate-binding domain-containing protein [Luteolibacter arcticus]MCW1922139.1 carbohydrate-binding domain-containing protein [Luteolibacter arcticus]